MAVKCAIPLCMEKNHLKIKSRKINVNMKENKYLFFSLYILLSMFSKTYFMHLLRHTITSPYICSYGRFGPP